MSAHSNARWREGFDGPMAAPRPPAKMRAGVTCPLCGGQAQASEGVVEQRISLLTCGHCRAFVIEKRLIEVVMNARQWNLRPVLQYVSFLSTAAQAAAAHGSVLVITSTNWIRVALEQQRLDAQTLGAVPAGSLR